MDRHTSKSNTITYKDKKKYIQKLFYEYGKTNDKAIRDIIFKKYMYIPEILSKKYMNKGVQYEDIYQVASLGLLYAIERFDPNKGYEFSSFATPTVLGEIKKYFRDKEWIVKVPRKIQELSKKIYEAKDELQHKLMRIPNITDIAEYLNISIEEVIQVMEGSYAYSPTSLDSKISNTKDDGDLSLFEVLGFEDQNIIDLENKDLINNIFRNINEYDKKILIDRFYKNKSQSEVANELNVSQMTVSRLEKKIINNIRNKFKLEV